MSNRPLISLLARTVQVILSVALLAVMPLMEISHAMPSKAAVGDVGVEMTISHVMHMSVEVTPAHGTDGTSCKINCLGWAQLPVAVRPEVPLLGLVTLTHATAVNLLEGASPAPKGHPPKTAPHV